MEGMRERTYTQKENLFGDSVPRWKRIRTNSESTVATSMPKRKFLTVAAFCDALKRVKPCYSRGTRQYTPMRLAEAFAMSAKVPADDGGR